MPTTHEFYGSEPQAVLDLLKRRKEEGYDPSTDNDGHKIALLFEGGAMAGLISAAAGAQLAELGYSNCFDTVYGTSSGALNATYFVANQSNVVLDVYKVETLAPEFMGIFRWPDQVNVKWLAQRISDEGPHHLDVSKIMSAKMELKISATDVETGKTRYFSNKTDPASNIIPATIASSSTPMFVTHREVIDGREYSDGLLRDGVQSMAAKADGHTHVVALLSNPVGRRKKSHVLRAILEQLVRIRFYPIDFQTAFHARAVFYNDALDLLHNGAPDFSTLVICPGKTDPTIGNLEKNTDVLVAAIDAQKARVSDIFSNNAKPVEYKNLAKPVQE